MFIRRLFATLSLLVLITACSMSPSTSDQSIPVAPQRVVEEGVELSESELLPGSLPHTREERAAVERRFALEALETAQPSVAVNNDVDQDTEPTVAALKIGTLDYTAVGFIKILPTSNPTLRPFEPRIYTTSTTNLSSFPAPTPVAIPASGLAGVTYLHTADPNLAVNTVNAGPGPLRTYMSGLAYNMIQSGRHPNGGVVVWRSDNGGSVWSGSTIVAEAGGSTRVLDKPAIAVSWNTASFDGHGPTVGNVYVAWCDVPYTGGTTDLRIMFSRSLDGGVTWSTPLQIASGYVHAPQVVVPYNTGRVFVLYARYTAGTGQAHNNSIEMVRSPRASRSPPSRRSPMHACSGREETRSTVPRTGCSPARSSRPATTRRSAFRWSGTAKNRSTRTRPTSITARSTAPGRPPT
jgi:hypothetical protein